MKRENFEKIRDKQIIDFFESFIKKMRYYKFKVLDWGWWPIGNGKYGLSLYWEVPDEKNTEENQEEPQMKDGAIEYIKQLKIEINRLKRELAEFREMEKK